MKVNGIFDFSKSIANTEGNLRYVVIHKGTIFPTTPTPQEGQQFYRTDLDTMYIYSGSAWLKSVNGIMASDIPVTDAGSNWTASDVEGVLDEIDGRLDSLETGAIDSKWNESVGILSPKTANAIVSMTTNGTVGTAFNMVVTGGANNVLVISNSGTGNSLVIDSNKLIVNAVGVGIGTAPTTEVLALGGALIVGNASGAVNGTIRWTGTDFEGRKSGTWASLTSATTNAGGSDGQIQYNDGGTAFGGAPQFVYDDTNHRVGISTASPLAKLHITSTTDDCIRMTNGANSFSVTVDGSGLLQFSNGTNNVLTVGQSTGVIVRDNVVNIGDGTTSANKVVYANNGDATKPFIQYNETTNEWEVSNDGTTTASIGGGGTTAYETSFDNSDLSSGILTVTHNLGVQYVLVVIYDNNNKQILPDDITATSTSVTTIDLSSYGILVGTWNVRCL
jgi:hypothetical protein